MRKMNPSIVILALLSATCYASAPCFDTPPSQGVICVQRGTVNLRRPIDTLANSAEECNKNCINSFDATGCGSLGYDSKNKTCRLWVRTLESLKFQQRTSDFEYFDPRCFNCLDTCPSPLGKNLVANGGFEQFPHAVFPWSSFDSQKTKVVQDGFHSAQALEQVVNLGNFLQQVFHTCPNSTYAINLDYKFTFKEDLGSSVLNIEVRDLTFIVAPKAAQNGVWQHLRLVYHTYQKGSHRSRLNIAGELGNRGVTFELDNVVVERVEALPTSNPSLISNGGFEMGLAPWRTERNKTDHSCELVHPGAKSSTAFMCRVSHGAADVAKQSIATTPKTAYLLSFDYKAISQKPKNSCFISYQFGHSAYLGPGFVNNLPGIANDTWLHFSQPVVATETSTQLQLIPGELSTNAISCDISFDNVKLVEAGI